MFNVVVGVAAGVFVFDYAVLHTIGTALVVYALMLVAPRFVPANLAPSFAVLLQRVWGLTRVARRKIVGRLVLLLLLAYLVGWYVAALGASELRSLACSTRDSCVCMRVHSHYYREFYSPDIVWDSAQMILTLKLSSVAINYGDGGVPKDKKTPAMIKNELQAVPALLPYFGTCLLSSLLGSAVLGG